MQKKRINIREIASMAGVSAAAVSYALNGDPANKLSEATRKKILEICERVHYYPNEHFRRVFSRSANTVAFFFPPQEEDVYQSRIDENFSSCMMGAQRELSSRGMDMILVETTQEYVEKKRYLRLIRGGLADGLLLWGTREYDSFFNELMAEEIPLVLLQSDLPEAHSVTSDDFLGGQMLARQVLAAGHRHIAILSPLMSSLFGRRFTAGINSVLAQAGVTPYTTQVSGFDDMSALRGLEEICANATDTTCIMASNDNVAWGCIRELTRIGVRVPEDISITGAGGLLNRSPMRLNSFYIPSYQIGRNGAIKLWQLINGEKTTDKKQVLPVELTNGTTLARPRLLGLPH